MMKLLINKVVGVVMERRGTLESSLVVVSTNLVINDMGRMWEREESAMFPTFCTLVNRMNAAVIFPNAK